jgi:homoserine kinase
MAEWHPATARVPASTSNVGAGFDFFGIALDLWLEVRIVEGEGTSIRRGELSSLPATEDTIDTILREAGLPREYHIEATSDIPLARGLGASAAACVAALGLASAGQGEHVERDRVFRSAAAREGHPDNAGPATYGGAVIAAPASETSDGACYARAVPVHPDVVVALCVPEMIIETSAARRSLPAQLSRADAVDQARRAAALVAGLAHADGELIHAGMVDRIAIPSRSRLIPGYGEAVSAGLKAGAYGVTISGSGSTLIALAPATTAAAVAQGMTEAVIGAGVPARPLTPAVMRRGLQLLSGSPRGER